jgi:hypothetical protein
MTLLLQCVCVCVNCLGGGLHSDKSCAVRVCNNYNIEWENYKVSHTYPFSHIYLSIDRPFTYCCMIKSVYVYCCAFICVLLLLVLCLMSNNNTDLSIIMLPLYLLNRQHLVVRVFLWEYLWTKIVKWFCQLIFMTWMSHRWAVMCCA